MSLPRYENYKDSGISWGGAMPNHWRLLRTKTLFELKRRPPREEDGVVTAFRDGEVTLRSNRRTEGFTNSLQEIGYQGIRKGDLVIHAMDAFAGAIGVSDSDGKSTPVYSVCEPRRGLSDSRYYARLLRHIALSGFIESLAKGVRERSTEFRWAEAGNVYLPVPPIEEQAAIAAFLDRETAKIDALIAEQETLIDLLSEKRQATISHAVTRGLDPSAPMTNSGVAWLGDVPAHWTMIRLKSICEFTTSGPRGWSERIAEDGSIFVQSGDLNQTLGVDFDTAKRVQVEDNAEAARTRLSDGDVVVCITGAKTGNVAVCWSVPEPAYVNQHLCLVRPNSKVMPAFLGTALKSSVGQTQFELSQYGLKQGLSLENVRETLIPLPPRSEQDHIVVFLESETSKLDALKLEAERAIDLFKERRSALIAAAVTGQIDLRAAANA